MKIYNKRLNTYFIICLLLFSIIPVPVAAPEIPNIGIYNKLVPSNEPLLSATIKTDDNAQYLYSWIDDSGNIHINSSEHLVNQTLIINEAVLKGLKGYNGKSLGITHINDDGTKDFYKQNIVINKDIPAFPLVYLTMDFSEIIINGMTGTTTTTLTGLSGNQSISIPDGSSYDLNITNNQEGVWASSDGRNYQNKSIITINGSMVTTESQIPLQLFTNLEGVNGTGDIGIAYTNLTAIPREVEAIWDSDNVSIYLPYNTTTGVDSQFVVLWGSDNSTEPAANSTYGSQAVWDSDYNMVQLMNTAANSKIIDSTSNGINSTSNSNFEAADTVDGDYGKGIIADGVNEYYGFGDVLDLNDMSYTLEFRLKGFEWSSGIGVIISKWYDGSNAEWNFGSLDDGASGTRLQFVFRDQANNNKYLNSNNAFDTTIEHTIQINYDGTTHRLYIDNVLHDSSVSTAIRQGNNAELRLFRYVHTSQNYYGAGTIYQTKISLNKYRDANWASTIHNNLNNPTASSTEPFYLSIGETQTATGTLNITASVTGDNNTQSYNTSQSREFTLTPTGETNNVLINTTSMDYDVTITTYWQEDTTLIEEIVASGYVKQYINYTPSANITSADLNTTIVNDLTAHNYLGTTISTLNDVSKTTTRVLQEVNASVDALTKDVEYLWNVTIPYNNIFTLSEQSNKDVYLGESESFTDSTYNDPEGLPIDSRLWKFGDGDTSGDSNPTHTYTAVGLLNANYTVTETATISPQTITKEFTVNVTLQKPQNVTTVSHQTSVDIDWDDYASADKFSIYEMEDGFSYINTNPTVDGIKDAIYAYAHEFLIFAANPVNTADYETIYPLRTSLGAYFLIESVDNDDKTGDDDTIYYFDLDNNGLTIDDPAWKITDHNVKKYLWKGTSWQVTGVTDADGASTGAGTHYPIHELFIPVAELGGNWTNGSTVKVLVKREDSALSPDVITWYPYGNINDSDTSLWQEMVLNDPNTYTWLANVTLSNYTAINLTPFTIYHGAVSTWNGTDESDYTLFDVITEDFPRYNASGYILNTGGDGIPNATVYSCNGFVHEITTTNETGYWIGYKFCNDTYIICANATGYDANSTSITIAGVDLFNINITLSVSAISNYDNFTFINAFLSPTVVRENSPFTVNVDINDTDGTITNAIVKISGNNYTMVNTVGDRWLYTFTETSLPTEYYIQNFYAKDDDGAWNSTTSNLSIFALSSTGTGSTGGISPIIPPEEEIEEIIKVPEKVEKVVSAIGNITRVLEKIVMNDDLLFFKVNYKSITSQFTKEFYIEDALACGFSSNFIKSCSVTDNIATVKVIFNPDDAGFLYNEKTNLMFYNDSVGRHTDFDIVIVNLMGVINIKNCIISNPTTLLFSSDIDNKINGIRVWWIITIGLIGLVYLVWRNKRE